MLMLYATVAANSLSKVDLNATLQCWCDCVATGADGGFSTAAGASAGSGSVAAVAAAAYLCCC